MGRIKVSVYVSVYVHQMGHEYFWLKFTQGVILELTANSVFICQG